MANQVNINTNNGEIGFLGLLTIVFITLKLTGYIAWSWWYVLSPFWIPLAFVLGLFAIVFLITVVADFVK